MSDAKLSSIKKSYITLKDLSKKVELTYLSEQTSNECKGYVVI
jgi:hypothetical protein